MGAGRPDGVDHHHHQRLLASLDHGGGGALGCTFARDGAMLVTVGGPHTVKVWDVGHPTGGECVRTLSGRPRSHSYSSPRRHARRSRSRSRRSRHLFRSDSEHPTRAPVRSRSDSSSRGHTKWVYKCALSPDDDGSQLATCSWDHTVCIWDTATWTQVRVLEGHTGGVSSASGSRRRRVSW